MEIIKHFEIYIAAQKATGMQFVFFGITLLVAATILQFNNLNPISQGLKSGFFVISVILLVSGVGFNINQNKLLETKSKTYQLNPSDFKKQELDRMQQVNQSVPKIILGLCITLLIIILAFILFINQPFWKGVSFSVLIYFLGLLILESISFLSVKNYLESLLN